MRGRVHAISTLKGLVADLRGIIEGCAKVAKNLLNLGMALDEVAKVTGLDIETIEKKK